MILASAERIAQYTADGWWGNRTIDDVFRANVAAHADREAVVDPPNRSEFTDGAPQRMTYRELDLLVGQMAAVLARHGIARDDVIAVQLPNIIELTAVYLAAARLGAIITPLPVQYREHELLYCLSHTKSKAVVSATRIGKHAHAAMFAGIRGELPDLRVVLALGDVTPDGVVSLTEALRRASSYSGRNDASANDVLTICWTSGTEALSKGVPRSHNEWLVIAPNIIEASRLSPGCRLLNPSPMVNMSGVSINIATWLTLAGTVIHHHPLSVPVLLQQLRDERLEYIVAPPAVLNMLLQQPQLLEGIDFERLRTIGSGGAPLSSWMVRGFQDKFGVDIVNHFGSNEGASLAGTRMDIPDPAQRATYFPRLGVEGMPTKLSSNKRNRSRIVDLSSGLTIIENGMPGELRFRGPTVFSGYWNAPEMTAAAFDAEGYYRTGDLFEIAGDEQQFYKYVGRAKDIVIRGGMNISSEEIETLAIEYPSVREAAVVGYPDPVMGEKVCLVVAFREGQSAALDEINGFLKDVKKVAIYKLPERLLVVEALPRNPVGKVLKRDLRDRLAAGAAKAGAR